MIFPSLVEKVQKLEEKGRGKFYQRLEINEKKTSVKKNIQTTYHSIGSI